MRVYSQSQGKFIDVPDSNVEPTTKLGSDKSANSLTNLSPEFVSLAQILYPGKTATALKTAYDIQQAAKKEANTGTEPKTAADAKYISSARSGIASVKRARDILFGENPEMADRTKLGGLIQLAGAQTGNLPIVGDITPWGRGLESDLFNAVDVILRARTGAQATTQEVRRYLKEKGPLVTDTAPVKKQKLDTLQEELQDALDSMGIKDSAGSANISPVVDQTNKRPSLSSFER